MRLQYSDIFHLNAEVSCIKCQIYIFVTGSLKQSAKHYYILTQKKQLPIPVSALQQMQKWLLVAVYDFRILGFRSSEDVTCEQVEGI